MRQVDHRSRLLTYKVGTHITGWVLKHKQPLIVEDLATDSRFKTTDQENKEIKSVLCVPIQFRAKVIGVLMVSNKKQLETFSNDDQRLLAIIAAQSGQLIRNSQLQQDALEKKRIDHELALARRIQLRLLPKKTPAFANLDIASYFNPAYEVGGDYYDYFLFNDQLLGIVLADVSGHGPSAALVMTMVKGILHSITRKFESASRVIEEMNCIITPILPPEIFVTMVFLVFEMKNRRLCYSNAGHNPMVFYSGDKQKCCIKELPGPALGISPSSRYQEEFISLNSGDLLVIYTDGLTEATDEHGEMYTLDTLIDIVTETGRKNAEIIIDSIKKSLYSFTATASQDDDIAIIAVKQLNN